MEKTEVDLLDIFISTLYYEVHGHDSLQTPAISFFAQLVKEQMAQNGQCFITSLTGDSRSLVQKALVGKTLLLQK